VGKTATSIARAVLKNPPIMILDSNIRLDTESEKFVQVAWEYDAKPNINRNSNRLSTIQKLMWIIVMQKRYNCRKGTHEELIALRGTSYNKLVTMQSLE
jgi:ABC-type transport system involved in Fe-S cluster assembly fused permease/ATPase subunit